MYIAHCYFTRLNPKRKDPFYFSLPALLGIHKESQPKIIFQIQQGILEMIKFIKFIHLEKHLDGAWDTFGKKSLIGTFTVHQKKTFGTKNF